MFKKRGIKGRKTLPNKAANNKKRQVPINGSETKQEKKLKLEVKSSTGLSYILQSFDVSDFLQNYWEKKPLILQDVKHSNLHKINKDVLSKSILEDLIKTEDVRFGRDIHACRCVNGVTEDLNLNKNGKVIPVGFNRLFNKQGATIQFHQPQRFIDPLWEVIESLESFFSCLVGANAYITPIGTQGLAPHYDDVEVFIIQLEGEKHWRLYEAPVKHARKYNANLKRNSIGKPTHEFILKPGDVLYMPRGTVHEADTPENCHSHSTHITLSTYQRHSWGSYLMTTFPQILETALTNSEMFRKGLPIGYLLSQHNSMDYFSKLMNELPSLIKPSLPSSQNLIEDFILSRLPPYGINQAELEDGPDGFPPKINSSIKLAYPKHIAFCSSQTCEDDDVNGDNDENEDDDEPSLANFVIVYTSLFNDRKNHMINSKDAVDPTVGTLKFPANYMEALEHLSSCDNLILVKDIKLASDTEKVQLATALWAQHLLLVK